MSDPQQCLKRRRSDSRMALVKEAEKWVTKLIEASALAPGEEYGSIIAHLRELLEPFMEFVEKADRATKHERFSSMLNHARSLFGQIETHRAWAQALRQKERQP